VFQLSPVVKMLLIFNVLVFVLSGFLMREGLLIDLLGLRYIFSERFIPTQLLSYSIVHAGFSHLFSNMLGLLVFGPILEMRLGARRFLFFYFATALGAGIIYSLVHLAEVYPFISTAREFLAAPDPDLFARVMAQAKGMISPEDSINFMDQYSRQPDNPSLKKIAIELVDNLIRKRENAPMVGASGAVYGVMLGFGYLFPNLRMMLLFPPIPVQAKYLIGFYAIAALFYAVERVPGDNVAHYAHLGGMLVGWLILRYWKLQPSRF